MEDNHRDSNVIIRSHKTKKNRQYNDLKKKDQQLATKNNAEN